MARTGETLQRLWPRHREDRLIWDSVAWWPAHYYSLIKSDIQAINNPVQIIKTNASESGRAGKILAGLF